ncbi:unnamed protein product [Durusdinium trenchii]|uniref:Secreted protein n=2 Tax=Durusdinium trenchii TaxID=1381693 RepID=A0ABP0N8L6_9DINO
MASFATRCNSLRESFAVLMVLASFSLPTFHAPRTSRRLCLCSPTAPAAFVCECTRM